jgi:hypothetical protein
MCDLLKIKYISFENLDITAMNQNVAYNGCVINKERNFSNCVKIVTFEYGQEEIK